MIQMQFIAIFFFVYLSNLSWGALNPRADISELYLDAANGFQLRYFNDVINVSLINLPEVWWCNLFKGP